MDVCHADINCCLLMTNEKSSATTLALGCRVTPALGRVHARQAHIQGVPGAECSHRTGLHSSSPPMASSFLIQYLSFKLHMQIATAER